MKNMKLLSKAELRKIIGGLEEPAGKCKISYYAPGSDSPTSYNISTNGTCAHHQIQANAECISLLERLNVSGDRCFYDCACDD